MEQCVLFVDDEPHILEGIKRTLRKESYEVLTATSAKEALLFLESREIPVVISDQNMPGVSGTEFLKQVSEKYPNTIRIMLSGASDQETAVEAINKGRIYRFITKPYNEFDLIYTIREIMQQLELLVQSRRLIKVTQRQSSYISQLEKENPGITQVDKDECGSIVIDDDFNNLDETLKDVNDRMNRFKSRLGME